MHTPFVNNLSTERGPMVERRDKSLGRLRSPNRPYWVTQQAVLGPELSPCGYNKQGAVTLKLNSIKEEQTGMRTDMLHRYQMDVQRNLVWQKRTLWERGKGRGERERGEGGGKEGRGWKHLVTPQSPTSRAEFQLFIKWTRSVSSSAFRGKYSISQMKNQVFLTYNTWVNRPEMQHK